MHSIRIDGSLLPNYIGKLVVIIGKVTKKSADGRSIEIKTTDGVPLNMLLPTTVDGNIEGHIEARGILQSKSTLLCESVLCFPQDFIENFDAEQYGEMIKLYNLFGQKIWGMHFDDN